MRLAAIVRAGYYPAPASIVDILKTFIRPAMPNLANLGGYQILDPCCGKGKALAGLAEVLLGCSAYGNELDTERAALAEKCLNVITCGPIEFLQVEGQFGLCLLNPPYTEGEEDRQEVEFLKLATPWIAPGGLLIYVVPEKIATRASVLQDLLNDYENVEIRRFPPKEYERFNQVVVFGVKRESSLSKGYFEVREFERILKDQGIADLTPNELSFLIPTSPGIEKFEVAVPNFGLAMEEAETSGAMATDKWQMVMTGGARGVGRFQPLMQMKPRHIALLTAAGFANGMRLDDDRLVKGYVERYIERETEQQGDSTITIKKQRQAAVLVTLNLITCAVERYDSRKKEEYETFLTENVDTLTHGIQDQYEPLYKMDLNGWKELIPTMRAPGKLPGHEGNGLLPAQQHVVAALGQRLRTEKAVGIVGEMGVGKAQPLDANVLTPDGWVKIGDVSVGDSVIDPDGGTARVIEIFPQGRREVFRVTFSDGAETETCAEHLWHVNTPERKWRGHPPKVMELQEIAKKYISDSGNARYFIPMVKPVSFNAKPLPLHPYLLGALLGDGSLSHHVHFSSADQELLDEVESLLPEGVSLVHRDKYDYAITTGKYGVRNPVLSTIRDLELNCRSERKFIPKEYLYSSVENRMALMQGLFDTDGCLATSKETSVEYTSVSKQLAEDVVELVRSLGGRASLGVKEKPTYTYRGEKRIGQPAYRVIASLPNGIRLFRLSRKRRSEYTKYGPTRAIVNIESAGVKETVCISVNSARELYVTDDYIVTHNTLVSIALKTLMMPIGYRQILPRKSRWWCCAQTTCRLSGSVR